MIDNWINDFKKVNQNALSVEWFVSPLEYFWPDGKQLFDKIFRASSRPDNVFDELVSPDIYKTSMQTDFRAKMMVFAFMRQDISKSYGVEIENGLMHLYRLDFLSCLSQWVYVIEGYCRRLFSVSSIQNVHPNSWTIPVSGDTKLDGLIHSIATCLADYLKGVMFRGTSDFHIERLNRHLLLHGNVQNKNFFSQKNCLLLMFVLDALVVIEMIMNNEFPQVFNERLGELEKIKRRRHIYTKQLEYSFQDDNLLRIEVLKEHL